MSYTPKFLEADMIAANVCTEWNQFINVRQNCCYYNEFASEQMKHANLNITWEFNPNSNQINLILKSSNNIELYRIVTSDNTRESIRFSADAMLIYAHDVILCQIFEKTE